MAVGKQEFLVCYDYGMGGLWGILMARTADEVSDAYPELVVVSERPKWMTDEDYEALRVVNSTTLMGHRGASSTRSWLTETSDAAAGMAAARRLLTLVAVRFRRGRRDVGIRMDLGEIHGSNGERAVKVLVSSNGGIVTAYRRQCARALAHLL